MNASHADPDDHLDQLLSLSAPSIAASTTSSEQDLEDLVTRARREQLRSPRRVAIAVGAGMSALLFVGGGVAVANDVLWSDWVEDPVGEYQFTLPSGNSCVVRVGDVESQDLRVEAAMQAFYAGDVSAKIRFDAAADERRLSPDNVQLADGTIVDLVPGSPLYNKDRDYRNTMEVAISTALTEELRQQGLSGDWTSNSEMTCTNDEEMAITPEDLGYSSDSGITP